MKVIACGNEKLVTILEPKYMDKKTRSEAASRVLAKHLPQEQLNKLINSEILRMFSDPKDRIAYTSIVLESLGPKVAKKIDAAKLERLVDVEIVQANGANPAIRETAGAKVIASFIDSIGKEEFARQVDEEILSFVISKDIPVYIDTTDWPADRVTALCEKMNLQYIPLLPRDQADVLLARGDIDGYKEVEYKVVEDTDLLNVHKDDKSFRQAWCFCSKQGVRFDMDRAREIHLQRVRARRNERLSSADFEINKAEDEDSPDQNLIKQLRRKRRGLRDIPQTLDMSKASCPDDLKKIWPKELR